MKRTLTLLVAFCCASAIAFELSLSPEERVRCEAEGGCIFVTAKAVVAKFHEAYRLGLKDGEKRCRSGV